MNVHNAHCYKDGQRVSDNKKGIPCSSSNVESPLCYINKLYWAFLLNHDVYPKNMLKKLWSVIFKIIKD